jgi:hypothetical protein
MNAPKAKSDGEESNQQDPWLEVVRQHVNSLRFGVVEIVVHESRVVQIEKTERVRFDKTQSESRPGRPV